MSHTNYTKFANQKMEEIQEPVIEKALEETVEQQDDFMEGVVANCNLLNVRAEPKPDAEVLRKVSVDTEVMIDPTESTEDFYKVYLADGSEGFCMKKFIEIE